MRTDGRQPALRHRTSVHFPNRVKFTQTDSTSTTCTTSSSGKWPKPPRILHSPIKQAPILAIFSPPLSSPPLSKGKRPCPSKYSTPEAATSRFSDWASNWSNPRGIYTSFRGLSRVPSLSRRLLTEISNATTSPVILGTSMPTRVRNQHRRHPTVPLGPSRRV